MYFGIFLECVIMGKRGRSEKYFISCAVSGSKYSNLSEIC